MSEGVPVIICIADYYAVRNIILFCAALRELIPEYSSARPLVKAAVLEPLFTYTNLMLSLRRLAISANRAVLKPAALPSVPT